MSNPHQPATAPGTSPGGVERRAALAEALGEEVWPADLARLQGPAASVRGAGGRGVLPLRRLPAGQQFANVQDVARALGTGTEQERF
ncbi:DUF2795 domain-containing protein [Geodermatophilus sp. TF02-6]|uniref:DUF2795 domain-containing protein n=1 Tax=Geodermatophilus sp. TF02-6 TaxID=2250575 RepID=UPI000DE9D390|nr:DUF2795 domain-containing protein [Geodermatophilus sp. TF02-6]RBY82502.1 DUF2795 domain-containing protein [Geodermatophilus sp. TF02-6]